MDICTARGIISNLNLKHLDHGSSNIQSQIFCKQIRFQSGLRYYNKCSPLRLKTSDDETFVDNYAKQDEDHESRLNEGGFFFDSPLKFLEDIDIKFDYQETYSVLVFGGGGVVALWFAAAVVNAIDSIPALPKVLELVGLGYTIWFSSRYLLFKKNRDELVARAEQIKQLVIGSSDD